MDQALRREARAQGDPDADVRQALRLRQSGALDEAIALLRRWPNVKEVRDVLAEVSPTWRSHCWTVAQGRQHSSGYMAGGPGVSLRLRWSVEIAPEGWQSAAHGKLLATELGVLAILAGDEVLVVGRSEGRPLWEREFTQGLQGCWLHPRARAQAVVTAEPHDGVLRLVAHDLSSGAEIGSTSLVRTAFLRVCGYTSQGALLLLDLRGRRLIAARETRPGTLGRVLWQSTVAPASLSPPFAVGGCVVTRLRGNQLGVLDATDGRLLWRRPTAERSRGVLADDHGLLLVESVCTLVALTLAGEERWRVALRGEATPLALSPRCVLAAWQHDHDSPEICALLDRRDGALLAKWQVEGALTDVALWGNQGVLVQRPTPWPEDPAPDAPFVVLHPNGETSALGVPVSRPIRIAPLGRSLIVLSDEALSCFEPKPAP